MFPFRKPPKRKLPPKPSWLRWLLLLFVGYAIFVAIVPGSKVNQNMQQAKENLQQNVNVDQYKNKIFPEHAAGLRINDTEAGSGNPAVCGQTVAVSYQSYLAQGNELPDSAAKEKPLRFTIGSGKVMPIFDRGVIGMKPGGKRSIIAPPLMSYGLADYKRADVPEGASVRFEMELLSVEPKLPDIDVMPYRIAEVAVGQGNMLVCGEAVAVRLRVWDLTGKQLYTNKGEKDSLVFTPSKAQVMLGIEQGVLGMMEGGIRLLIIPPAFQKTMNGSKPAFEFPLPVNQTVMVEVEAQALPDLPAQ